MDGTATRDAGERIDELLKANTRFEQEAREARSMLKIEVAASQDQARRMALVLSDLDTARRRIATLEGDNAALERSRDGYLDEAERLHRENERLKGQLALTVPVDAATSEIVRKLGDKPGQHRFMNGETVYGRPDAILAAEGCAKRAGMVDDLERTIRNLRAEVGRLTIQRDAADTITAKRNEQVEALEATIKKLREQVDDMRRVGGAYMVGDHVVHGSPAAIDALADKVRKAESEAERWHRAAMDAGVVVAHGGLLIPKVDHNEGHRVRGHDDNVERIKAHIEALKSERDSARFEAGTWQQKALDLGARLSNAATKSRDAREAAKVLAERTKRLDNDLRFEEA